MYVRRHIALSAATLAVAVTAFSIAQTAPSTPPADSPHWQNAMPAPTPVPQQVTPPQSVQVQVDPAAQQQQQVPQQPAPTAAPKLTQPEMDQLLAPIALYPDALLSQVLMASTYPLEVVQARRWIQSQPNLQGQPLADALAQQPWDPSVKSLINTPTVMQLLDERLDWTIQLGDVFLAQQGDVMDAVQRLRTQAQQAGTLQNSNQGRVTVVPATPPPAAQYPEASTAPPVANYITIESPTPDVVYVPVYDPGTAYGAWSYPDYQPFFWHPSTYVVTRGIWYDSCRVGPAWSYAWSRPDWRVRHIELDDRRHAELNDRMYRDAVVQRIRERDHDVDNGRAVWQHDSAHRLGVGYRDANTARQFNGRVDENRSRSRSVDPARAQGQSIPGSTPPNRVGRPNGGQELPGANPPNRAGRPSGAQEMPGATPPNRAGRPNGGQTLPGATPPNAIGRPQVKPDVAPAQPVDPAKPRGSDPTPPAKRDATDRQRDAAPADPKKGTADVPAGQNPRTDNPPDRSRQRDSTAGDGNAKGAKNGDAKPQVDGSSPNRSPAHREVAPAPTTPAAPAQPGPPKDPPRPVPQQEPARPAPQRVIPSAPADPKPAAPRGSAPERPAPAPKAEAPKADPPPRPAPQPAPQPAPAPKAEAPRPEPAPRPAPKADPTPAPQPQPSHGDRGNGGGDGSSDGGNGNGAGRGGRQR